MWLLAATGVFINGSVLNVAMYLVTFTYFTAVHYNFKLSMPFGFLQTFQSFFTGFFHFFESIATHLNRPKEEKNNNNSIRNYGKS